MKQLLALSFLVLSTSASAQSLCGYGSLEKTITCKITSSATYEAGHTETYDEATIKLNGRFPGRGDFKVGGVPGKLVYSIGTGGTNLYIALVKKVDGIPSSQTLPVSFPEACNATVSLVTLSGKYVLTNEQGSSNRDLTIDCQLSTEFVED